MAHCDTIADRHGIEFIRNAAGFANFFADQFADLFQVAMSRHDTGVGIANPDKRFGKVFGFQSSRPHKRTMRRAFRALLHDITAHDGSFQSSPQSTVHSPQLKIRGKQTAKTNNKFKAVIYNRFDVLATFLATDFKDFVFTTEYTEKHGGRCFHHGGREEQKNMVLFFCVLPCAMLTLISLSVVKKKQRISGRRYDGVRILVFLSICATRISTIPASCAAEHEVVSYQP